MTVDELYLMNPWWRDLKAIFSDKHIVSFERSAFPYYPEKLFKEISPDSLGTYTIRGPRQIGKTTFLKLYIRNLIENGVNPTRIFFLTCDGLKDRFELTEMVKVYFQISERRPDEIAYLFIDEISTIADWQMSIKYLVDIGLLENCITILTGSSSYDLKKSSERLPGRKGHGKDLVFMPLTFGEFLQNMKIDLAKRTIQEFLSLSSQELEKLHLQYTFLKEYFLKYLNSGGFPKVIADFQKEGGITEIAKNIYRDFVLGDAEKYLRSRTSVLEILKKLPDIVGQRFSWNSLLDIFSGRIESVDTIQKFFEYLGYSFIVANVFYVDLSRKAAKPKKQKKVYPVDRIIAEITSEISRKRIELPQLLEMLTLRHLLTQKDLLYHGMNLYNGPYYWYSERGNEIDFVCEREGFLFPIEVKYQNRISKSDYLGMKRVFGKGVLITSDIVFKDENIVGLPAWLFFAMIDVP